MTVKFFSVVNTLAHSFLIGFSTFLAETRAAIISWIAPLFLFSSFSFLAVSRMNCEFQPDSMRR